MTWLTQNWAWIAGFIIALDTALAEIPGVQSNSTFQLITGWIKSLLGVVPPPKQ